MESNEMLDLFMLKEPALVSIDIQESEYVNRRMRSRYRDLAEFALQFNKIIWIMDSRVEGAGATPYIPLPLRGNKVFCKHLEQHGHMLEKEFGGPLRIASDAGMGWQAVTFYRSLKKGMGNSRLKREYGDLISGVQTGMPQASVMSKSVDNTFNWLRSRANELIDNISVDLVKGWGSSIVLVGGLEQRCLRETWLMLQALNIPVHIHQPLIYSEVLPCQTKRIKARIARANLKKG